MSTPPPKTTRSIVRPATARNAHRPAVDGVGRGHGVPVSGGVHRAPDESAPGEAAGVGDWADEAARADSGLPLLDGDLLDSVASFLEPADVARLGRSCKHFGLPDQQNQLSLANSALLRKLLMDHGIAPGEVDTLSKSTGMPKLGLLNFMQMVNNPSICVLLQKLGFCKLQGFKELVESKLAELEAENNARFDEANAMYAENEARIAESEAMNAQNEIRTAEIEARIAAVEAENASLAAMNAVNVARIAALEASIS